MKKLFVGLFLLGFFGAVSASDNISQSHKDAALNLLSTMKMGEQFSNSLETAIDAQLTILTWPVTDRLFLIFMTNTSVGKMLKGVLLCCMRKTLRKKK